MICGQSSFCALVRIICGFASLFLCGELSEDASRRLRPSPSASAASTAKATAAEMPFEEYLRLGVLEPLGRCLMSGERIEVRFILIRQCHGSTKKTDEQDRDLPF